MSGEALGEMGRRPMQWSGGKYSGLLAVAPWKMPDDKAVYNVLTQIADPYSPLLHYRALTSLRNNHPVLRIGNLS